MILYIYMTLYLYICNIHLLIYIYTYIIVLFRGTCRLVRAFPPRPSSVASWARGVVRGSSRPKRPWRRRPTSSGGVLFFNDRRGTGWWFLDNPLCNVISTDIHISSYYIIYIYTRRWFLEHLLFSISYM